MFSHWIYSSTARREPGEPTRNPYRRWGGRKFNNIKNADDVVLIAIKEEKQQDLVKDRVGLRVLVLETRV